MSVQDLCGYSGEAAAWPRLLYLGDVPVEASYHGSALLYRLLQPCPAGRLRIIETGTAPSRIERRLHTAGYRYIGRPPGRWSRSRLWVWVNTWQACMARLRPGRAEEALDDFEPQAVLSVAHGFGWLTAAAFAARRRLPLYLIVHDDWPRVTPLIWPLKRWPERVFGRIYRAATARFCVSPWMATAYRGRYGAVGRVLYPARALGQNIYDSPPKRLRASATPLTVAFAGSLNTADYLRRIAVLGRCLAQRGARLLLFGPATPAELAAAGLDLPSIECRGLLTSAQLIDTLRREADVLFLPMSFAPQDAAAMALNFPSKLTDYTATGLPLLIWGPAESSAVKWALDNPDTAVLVTEDDAARLAGALDRLAADASYRWRLAERALEVGAVYFSAQRAGACFYDALCPVPC